MPSAEHRGAFVERNRAGVQDYAAKKRAAIERANQIREERKQQRGEVSAPDALDAHLQGTPTAKSREPPAQSRDYHRSDQMRHENQMDAIDSLGGLVNTSSSSRKYADYERESCRISQEDGSDALDGLMRSRDGGARGYEPAYDEGMARRGFREDPRPLHNEPSEHGFRTFAPQPRSEPRHGQREMGGTEVRPLSRQDSLTLLKKRNPNATRRRGSTCTIRRTQSDPEVNRESDMRRGHEEQENEPEWNLRDYQPSSQRGRAKTKKVMPEWNSDTEVRGVEEDPIMAPPRREAKESRPKRIPERKKVVRKEWNNDIDTPLDNWGADSNPNTVVQRKGPPKVQNSPDAQKNERHGGRRDERVNDSHRMMREEAPRGGSRKSPHGAAGSGGYQNESYMAQKKYDEDQYQAVCEQYRELQTDKAGLGRKNRGGLRETPKEEGAAEGYAARHQKGRENRGRESYEQRHVQAQDQTERRRTEKRQEESSFRGMSTEEVSMRKREEARFDDTIQTIQKKPAQTQIHIDKGGHTEPAADPEGLITEAVSGQMGTCRLCSRSFFIEKLAKHEKVCPGVKVTKRDPKKAKLGAMHAVTAASTPPQGKSSKNKRPEAAIHKPIPKWKRESNQLKDAMRAARAYASKDPEKIAAYEAAPPAPSEPDPDLVPCPHCGRRFNAEAAERHIPHCKHTKAKPKRLLRGQGGAGGGNKGAPVVSRSRR